MRWVWEPSRGRPEWAGGVGAEARRDAEPHIMVIHGELIIDVPLPLRHIPGRAGPTAVRREPRSGGAMLSQAAGGQGSNSAIMRQFNERVILTALRRLGEASKADLARQASLTQNTAGQIVRELERQRLVRSVGKR